MKHHVLTEKIRQLVLMISDAQQRKELSQQFLTRTSVIRRNIAQCNGEEAKCEKQP